MKRSKLLFTLATVVIIASMVLGACTTTPTAEPEVVEPVETGEELAVGIVLPTKGEPRWSQDETRL